MVLLSRGDKPFKIAFLAWIIIFSAPLSVQHSTDIPITVKTRIGVDNNCSKEFLYKFVESCTDNGAEKIIIHARKAILKGLSPRDNRTIPPLNYERVKSVKNKFKLQW
jgi:tRNA-dihydrouridine synthase A